MNAKIFSSALSREKGALKAIQELATKVKADLKNQSCDLAVLFVSERYEDLNPEELCRTAHELLSPAFFIGCNTSGVIADRNEIEMEPAMSLLAMHLPGVRLSEFSLTPGHIEIVRNGEDLANHIGVSAAEKPNFICLADPMTCDIRKLLDLFNKGYPGAPVIGGLASANMLGVSNWFILNGELYSEGAVGVALVGGVQFDTLVSQGCRPVGEPFIITRANQNVLYELASRPALQVLAEVLNKLPLEDQHLAEHSLFVGIVMDEGQHYLGRGDFLIRNIMGADQESGAITIGEMLEPGQTLQFQLRDAVTSEEDLQILLKKLNVKEKSSSEGAILVSCCGRGKGLYGEPHHDARLIQSIRGPVPLVGFFANGEFGIINKVNYVHGYTSSLTILR